MTIYMVEHVFAKPDWEADWNSFYGENLKVLMSVPGFRTCQRFKAVVGSPPRYMAMYTVDSPAVFQSKRYIDAGGNGKNSERFRAAYQTWIRNLFDGIDVAPNLLDGNCLVSVDATERQWDLAHIPLTWLTSTGFHKTTPYRGIGVATAAQVETLLNKNGVTLYRPLTVQQQRPS